MQIFQVIRILTLSSVSFLIAMVLTPFLLKFLYKYKLGKQIRTAGVPVFAKFHKKKQGTPTMGGILVWFTVLVVIGFFWLFNFLGLGFLFDDFNFLSRSQTFLPLGVLVFSALIGLGDDLIGIFGVGKNKGLRMKDRIILYTVVAIIGAWWFFFKLDWDLLRIPFLGEYNIGIWYIPIFVFIIVATAFSVNETDGLDGLAGGVLLTAFAAYGIISFAQGRYDLAAFISVIIGALVAFLWFNIYPARFFMGDTGSMSLGVVLGVIAMLTNAALVLPVIGIIFVVESASVIIQMSYKKLTGKKIFFSTPIHHHFEAKEWPETLITQRFWIISGLGAAIGVIIALIG